MIREHVVRTSIIFFAVSLYFLFMVPEDLTWRNVAYDAPNYLMSAKYLTLSHPSPGSPLYNLFNAGWIRVIPFGTDYFKLALVSVLFSAGTAALLYHITRSAMAPLIWVVSTVVVSQSTVLEVYTPISFLIVLAYWLHLTGNKKWAFAVIGLGVGVHHLIAFLFVVLIAKDYWQNRNFLQTVKPALWVLIGVPLFLYIPLANREPYIWIGGNSPTDYYRYFFSQGGLIGGLSIVPAGDLIERFAEFSTIALASLGIVIVAIPLAFKYYPDKALVFLIIIITTYYFTNLAPQVYTYLTPVIALCAIVIGTHFRNYNHRGATIAVAFGGFMLIMNIFVFNIDHSAAPEFYTSLSHIPPNSVVWSQNRGWEKTTIELYNMNEGTSIDHVNLEKPFRNDNELMYQLSLAQDEKRLFRTVVLNPKSYRVTLVDTSAQFVMLDYLSLDAPRP